MITTQRTTLRPIAPSDNEQVYHYRSDHITNQYQGFVPKTLEEVDAFIARNPSQFNQADTWFQLVIVHQQTNQIIGDVGVHFIGEAQAEVGCTLDKDYHGKGFATEVLQATIGYLFQQLHKHRVITSIDPNNHASISLVERLGFRKEAHFKESFYFKGQWVDDIIYAILQREWL